jgi:hypothetical protein
MTRWLILTALVLDLCLAGHARVVAGGAGAAAPRLVAGGVIGQLETPQVRAVRRFRYDETSGKCLDAEGREGYNRSSRAELETTGDAECVDFRGRFNLTYLHLRSANLRGANFADVSWYLGEIADSDLTGADLSRTSGQMVYRRSRLRAANLSRADLHYADLAEADLDRADLRGARFNVRTRLPFDRDEALRRGMVFDVEP